MKILNKLKSENYDGNNFLKKGSKLTFFLQRTSASIIDGLLISLLIFTGIYFHNLVAGFDTFPSNFNSIGLQIVLGIFYSIASFGGLILTAFIDPVIALIVFFISLLYFSFFESKFGCTLGKLLLQLRVVNQNAQKPTIFQSILRYLLKFVSAAPVLFGLLRAGFKNKLTYHEILSGVIVVPESDKITKLKILALGTINISFIILSIFTVALSFLKIDSFVFNIPINAKANVYKVQESVEIFAVDWEGVYPSNVDIFYTEAIKKNYWKEIKNYYKNKLVLETPIIPLWQVKPEKNIPIRPLDIADYHKYETAKNKQFFKGYVLYQALDCKKNIADRKNECFSYKLYAVEKDGSLIRDKGKVFFINNY